MKVELEEAKKVEDILLKQIKDKTQEQEKLEEEVVCLRKKLENAPRKINTSQMTSSGKLNEILNAQRSPQIKTGIGYEGESIKGKEKENKNIIFVNADEDIKASQKIPKEEETCNEVDRNQKESQMKKDEINKLSTEKGSYTPEYVKFGSHQRRFFPPMKYATCYACHKLGHIVAYCYTRRINTNQQRMQTMKIFPQANKWRRQPFIRNANCFYGYCFYCKKFGHKIIECRKYGQRLMFKTSRMFMNH